MPGGGPGGGPGGRPGGGPGGSIRGIGPLRPPGIPGGLRNGGAPENTQNTHSSVKAPTLYIPFIFGVFAEIQEEM